jgi:NAD(P)-dependent dehydrogenase (short-subunit alcohol dehydrogenase family)
MFNLSRLNILVTGASRGLGLATANGLSSLGANVIGVGRSERPKELDEPIQYYAADLNSTSDLNDLADFVGREFKFLNSLVNIAGISIPPSTEEEELTRFQNTVENDLVLPFAVISKFLPLFSTNQKSTIVNFSSINATLGFPGNPGYVASKAGLSGLTRGLAVDLASKGIRVNSISPGYFPTSMTTQSFNDESMHSERANRTVLKRWGVPSELVGPVAFLCSDASSYITGHDLPVDGGWLIQGLK